MFIAEIGINHNGNLELAKELILMAKRSGADVVKFQKRNVDENISEQDKGTLKKTLDGYMPYEDYKHMLEFDAFQYAEIDRFCKDIGIKWTASVWDIPSVEFISNFNVPFIKIPSARLNELDLLYAVNKTNIPVILSTGMSSYYEVSTSINILKNLIVIMHCKSVYPPKDEDLNLSIIPHLKLKYPEYKIGYSSHDTSIYPLICASSLGAEVFEVHITLNKNMYGSDQKCSFEEFELSKMINLINQSKKWMGEPHIQCLESEIASKNKLRRNRKE